MDQNLFLKEVDDKSLENQNRIRCIVNTAGSSEYIYERLDGLKVKFSHSEYNRLLKMGISFSELDQVDFINLTNKING